MHGSRDHKSIDAATTLAVIIRTVSRPRYLLELIESLEVQTTRGFNIIAINNGGSDQVQSILEKWQLQSDLRVSIRRNYQNESLALDDEMRSYSYLLFPGDDDLYYPDAIERVLAGTAANPNAALLTYASKPIGPLGWRLPGLFQPCLNAHSSEASLLGRLLGDSCLVFSATVFPTWAITDSEFDFRNFPYVTDWLLFLIAASTGPVVADNSPILYSRVHKSQDWRFGDSNELESLRTSMLVSFIFSSAFHNYLAEATDEDKRTLIESFLQYGETQGGRTRDFEVYAALRLQLTLSTNSLHSCPEPTRALLNSSSEELKTAARQMPFSSAADLEVGDIRWITDTRQHIELLLTMFMGKLRSRVNQLRRR